MNHLEVIYNDVLTNIVGGLVLPFWVAPEPSEGWKLEFSSPWPHTTKDIHGEVKNIYISIHVTCTHSMNVHVLICVGSYMYMFITMCIFSLSVLSMSTYICSEDSTAV